MDIGTRVVIVGTTNHAEKHGMVLTFNSDMERRNTRVELDSNGATLMFDTVEVREETADDLASLPSEDQRHLLSIAYNAIHASETENDVRQGWQTLYDSLTSVILAA